MIENQQVVDLPVKDREFLELALLGAGVVNPPGGTRGDSLQQTGKLINILGQRTGHNLFLVDGVSVTDEYYNNVVLNPSPDAMQRIQHRQDRLRRRVWREIGRRHQRHHAIRHEQLAWKRLRIHPE